MIIGVYYIELQIPGIRNRKEKRSVINSLKQKLRNKHNIAVSEVAFQDLLQRSAIGISTVSLNKTGAEKCFSAVYEQISNFFQVQITHTEKEFL